MNEISQNKAIDGRSEQDLTTADKPEFRSLRLCTNHRAGTVLPSCGARGAAALQEILEKEIAAREGTDTPLPVKLETVHCMGKCHIGPTLRIIPAGPFFMGVCTEEEVKRLFDLITEGEVEQAASEFPSPPSAYD